ncbi:MarC family protein [Pleurocapsa sp. FMAR1]|uniref:MarC family protein n=1 Tax=Pleurocapsa sp. FMAR1 TaxID=3040204 RepID=UPI0029C8CFDA|nr:MarC family protein [Pleurocapsa sp. FMAR1]
MEQFCGFLVQSLAALIPVVDPIGLVPIFLSLTVGTPFKLRKKYARQTAIYAVCLLIFFLLVGGNILRFFGISLEIVKIAGGIIVFKAGWQTLNSEPKLKPTAAKNSTTYEENYEDISFIPMTIPLSAGPGSIAITLGLAAEAGHSFDWQTGINLLAVGLAIIIVGALLYLCLRFSNLLLLALKETGIKALSRLLGLFILAVGVKLILNGLADWVANIVLNAAS